MLLPGEQIGSRGSRVPGGNLARVSDDRLVVVLGGDRGLCLKTRVRYR
jgi:hypothetical protein